MLASKTHSALNHEGIPALINLRNLRPPMKTQDSKCESRLGRKKFPTRTPSVADMKAQTSYLPRIQKKVRLQRFTNASSMQELIADDVESLHLLYRLGYYATVQVKGSFIDTFHLFPKTLSFLDEVVTT